MKTFVASAGSLVLGLALGWYFEHQRAEREKAEIVQQMVDGTEHAARAARAIQSIQSGDTQQAVQLLSTPAAYYYTVYTDPGSGDQHRSETRALIEQVAKTNQILAARIAELSSNLRRKAP